MTKFKLIYKNDNIEMIFQGPIEELDSVLKKLKSDSFIDIKNNYHLSSSVANSHRVDTKDNKKNNIKSDKKTFNEECLKEEITINEEYIKKWVDFYGVNNSKIKKSYQKILLLLYWINENKEHLGDFNVNKNTIYSFLYQAGDKLNYSLQDAIYNSSRKGRAYLENKDNNYYISHRGIVFMNNIINDENKGETI
ncbi:hypothetical protein [uncultured Brachyspira sp.]|uniref:hypothetical protein n=1 Tax=uncultured Brachyspira sp. TaxID=221953 RepID=UPI00262DC90C|nr:hypothetical protein [uncultured Brachyspira sp.]